MAPHSAKGAIRISRLRVGGAGPKTLQAAEAHGKRQDASSQRRRVADVPPLVIGGLDLTSLYTAHTAGTRMDKRTRCPVMHCIVQWPKTLPVNEKNQRAMIRHATAFMNQLLGGEAVFAARLDRDEKGQHVVDVFATPTVIKKDGSRWVQTSKHLKALCERHRAEIERRHPNIKDITSPRCQGIALQSEWRAYLDRLGFDMAPKREKTYGSPDWVTPERLALDAEAAAVANRRRQLDKAAEALEADRQRLEADRQRLEADHKRLEASSAALEAERRQLELERGQALQTIGWFSHRQRQLEEWACEHGVEGPRRYPDDPYDYDGP